LLGTPKQIQISPFPTLEITMPKVNLSTMDIQSLMDLRKRIDERLRECRADIEKRLARLDRSIGDKAIGLRRVE
jgi:ribose 1,5-bisphosphokinase PhnN